MLRFASPTPQSVTSVGAVLSGLEPLPTAWPAAAWVVLIGLPGAAIDVATAEARALLHWLRGLRPERRRLELLTICAGSVLAAHAGLLAGRRATTHHQHLAELQQVEPRCDVVANRVFVPDAPLYSSAGVTTGIDLVLHRIADECGPAIAAQVAQTMVVALRRGPHDPEFSPFLAHRNHLHPALHRVQDAVSQHPAGDWSVPAMAEVAHASPRHLTRLFIDHAGIAPGLAAHHPAGHGRGGTEHRPHGDAGRGPGRLQFGHSAAPGMAPVRARRYAVGAGPRLSALFRNAACASTRHRWMLPFSPRLVRPSSAF